MIIINSFYKQLIVGITGLVGNILGISCFYKKVSLNPRINRLKGPPAYSPVGMFLTFWVNFSSSLSFSRYILHDNLLFRLSRRVSMIWCWVWLCLTPSTSSLEYFSSVCPVSMSSKGQHVATFDQINFGILIFVYLISCVKKYEFVRVYLTLSSV